MTAERRVPEVLVEVLDAAVVAEATDRGRVFDTHPRSKARNRRSSDRARPVRPS